MKAFLLRRLLAMVPMLCIMIATKMNAMTRKLLAKKMASLSSGVIAILPHGIRIGISQSAWS